VRPIRALLGSARRLVGRTSATVMLLAAATGASLIAWSLQASAAANLRAAAVVQARETAGGGEPPSPTENRRIIETLDRSIEIRRQVDEQLQRIEASVAALSGSSGAARDIAEAVLVEVGRIGAELGGAGRAARFSIDRLAALRGQLRASLRLAEKIAEELEELDRKLGPSAGGR
jgi:hypothetical protein